MYNKLIIITPREFSNKEYIKNSIKDFIKKKIKVEIWIIKKILNPVSQINKELLAVDRNITFKIIDNIIELRENLVKEKKSTLFDVRVKLNIKTKSFFSTFFNFDYDYIVISGLFTQKINFIYKLYYKLKNFLISIFFIMNKIKIKQSKYYFVLGGKCDSQINLLINSKSIMIKGHHADYDRYLEKKEREMKFKKDYFVFLDQNVPFHQDLVEMHMNDINENNYYSSVLNFLEITKKKYNLNYLISPHPRSDLKKLKKYFGNMVSEMNTLETVRQCKFVLCHDSTAVNFAFLFFKPVISIYDNELANSKYNHLKAIKRFCYRTRSPLKNVHRDEIEDYDFQISKQFYSEFINNFVKCHNENKKRVDILTEYINFYE